MFQEPGFPFRFAAGYPGLFMSRIIPLALVVALSLQAACGGGGGAVESARFYYSKGNLERAESSLEGRESADARALRTLILKRRGTRSSLTERLEGFGRIDPRQALENLESLVFDGDDPVAREWVELARSETYDRLAERGGSAHRPIHPTGYHSDELADNEIEGEPSVVVRHERFEAPAPERALAGGPSVERPSRELGSKALTEPRAGARAQAASGPEEPAGGAREAAAGLETDSPSGAGEPETSTDLLAAAERWIDAGFAARPGAERNAYIARARGLERRYRLREEIAAGRARDPERFAERCAIRAASPEGLSLAGGFITWEALSLEVLEEAARLSELSQEAELGLLDERLLRGSAAQCSAALAQLPRLVKREILREEEAWDIIARQRAEEVPDGGYVFDSGRWLERPEFERTLLLARIDELESELAGAVATKRDEAFEALDDLEESASPALHRALTVRWERALRGIKRGKTLRNLEQLAELRRALDLQREAALELIFDTVEYFYPYRAPAVPWEKAKLYPEVQARVDDRVARVRDAWEAGRAVSVSRAFREGTEELAWVLERSEEVEVAFEWPTEIPEWLFAVETRLDPLTLHDFAWTVEERDRLARDRAVRDLNGRNWAVDSRADEQQPSNGERVQVEITNAYRVMFGRRALAWNAAIQAAAVMHSDYMANSGDFGHTEPDPERRTPGDRMRLCGYTSGVGENCHAGSGDPGGAHSGWIRSSGHHRNILSPGHREMASAQRGRYWTQNFGVSRAFETDLHTWQD